MKFNFTMLIVLLSFGLFIQPLALFAVNDFIFGKYLGDGFIGFYNRYYELLMTGNPQSWFILIMPYLVFLVAKFTLKILK